MSVDKSDLKVTKTGVQFSFNFIIGSLGVLTLAAFSFVCGWLWMLHMRTDHIPVIEKEVEYISGSVKRLEDWAGTTPKNSTPQSDVATTPKDHPSNAVSR